MKTESFINNIILKKDSLPKQQRIFCNFLLENYYSIGLDSVSVMAQKASVGTTTVLRTVAALGYENFNDFKRDIHASVLELKTPYWYQFEDGSQNDSSQTESIENVWLEINQLHKLTLNEQLINNIEQAVEIILNANTTHVLGLRTSKAAAMLFENLVNGFYPNINQLSYDSHFVFDRIFNFKKGDVLLVIALSPFTKMTLDAAKYCHEQGHPIILITDHNSCSIIPFANIVLRTLSNKNQYSIVPVISLIETLTIALGKALATESRSTLDKIGKVLVEKEITTL